MLPVSNPYFWKWCYSKANIASQWTYALNLWCLNSAVVMQEIKESTRSIIVTSGTLSPLASYQSELDIDFKLTLEANHVIPAQRVWIGTISQGPKNSLLNGTFKVTGTFEYQVYLLFPSSAIDKCLSILLLFRMNWAACYRPFARPFHTVSCVSCPLTVCWKSSSLDGRTLDFGKNYLHLKRLCANREIRVISRKH